LARFFCPPIPGYAPSSAAKPAARAPFLPQAKVPGKRAAFRVKKAPQRPAAGAFFFLPQQPPATTLNAV